MPQPYTGRLVTLAPLGLEPGRVVGDYVIDGEIGRGGAAVVLRVHHAGTGQPFAMKVLPPAMDFIRRRFLAEGMLQRDLVHDNVVGAVDLLEIGASPAIVMELVDGPDLRRALEGFRPDLLQVDDLAVGLLRGVEALHAVGGVHRDLKPSNVLLDLSGGRVRARITDFGLAKLFDPPAGAVRTVSGTLMGTPGYMAPEQHRDAKHVDERADVFALGAILYELVTGERAFPPAELHTTFQRVAARGYVPLGDAAPTAPARMVAAIEAALTPDPELRVPSVPVLIEVWLGGRNPPAVPRSVWSQADVAKLASLGPRRPSGDAQASVTRTVAPPPPPARARWLLWVAAGVITTVAVLAVAVAVGVALGGAAGP